MKTVGLLLTALALIASPAIAQTSDQYLITPGVGIGPVRVGMTIIEVTAILGKPKTTQAIQNGRIIGYGWVDVVRHADGTSSVAKGGLVVSCTPSGQVIRAIAYLAPTYTTAEGLHTKGPGDDPWGSTEREVRTVLGSPSRVDSGSPIPTHILVYPSGIRFHISELSDGKGMVIQIDVFAP